MLLLLLLLCVAYGWRRVKPRPVKTMLHRSIMQIPLTCGCRNAASGSAS